MMMMMMMMIVVVEEEMVDRGCLADYLFSEQQLLW